ncbi:BufA2 family periplasmic bufferin-type metallophore, partial [Pseudoalteromonas piscicida]|uniref:BufA2 family periplasmic bufferin-type metallophore n=1 Tax=Pseudoalteromonas piscicida TaxID=43662 RepID=UPI00126C86B5
MKALTGAAMAIMVAGLVGCNSTENNSTNAQAATAETDLVHCYDVNTCGGHNDCKTASNACSGHASCKGTGFVSMPRKACSDIGGKA